jgi:acetyltransferase-like isoleucine patch superfamily enzyme
MRMIAQMMNFLFCVWEHFISGVERFRCYIFVRMYSSHKNVHLDRVRLTGIPLIKVCPNGKLLLGDNVWLRSKNSGYHVNLFGPVKLQVSYPGAKIVIGARSRIYGSSLNAYRSIEIGADCLIAGNCQIMDADGHCLHFDCLEKRATSKDKGRPVVLEDYVWLGTGCIVLPGVRIGRGSVIGAGSVVSRDIPPLCIAAGNPAKVVRRFNNLGERVSLEEE